MVHLRNGRSIILFRFHDYADIAIERIKIIRYLNPETPIYILFGGSEDMPSRYRGDLERLTDGIWTYARPVSKKWKWLHTDLILKEWYREIGKNITFDFLFSYEYDLLTLLPLSEIYPDIDEDTLALAACTDFTKDIEDSWTWTSKQPWRDQYMEFSSYLKERYGIARQQKVCLGPAPLLPKKFLQEWSKTEDIDLVHDELAYPAYAEALGFKTVDHRMHPGFGAPLEDQKFFNCYNDLLVTTKLIEDELTKTNGCRTFHPVKQMITLDSIVGIV